MGSDSSPSLPVFHSLSQQCLLAAGRSNFQSMTRLLYVLDPASATTALDISPAERHSMLPSSPLTGPLRTYRPIEPFEILTIAWNSS